VERVCGGARRTRAQGEGGRVCAGSWRGGGVVDLPDDFDEAFEGEHRRCSVAALTIAYAAAHPEDTVFREYLDR
jgi:hypothetical protein